MKEVLSQPRELQSYDAGTRSLACFILAIHQGLHEAERSGLAGASITAEKVITDNIEIYSQLAPGRTIIPEQQAGLILAKTEKLSVQEIADGGTKIKALMAIVGTSPTLKDVERLRRYLTMKLPTTEKSFRVLKGIAIKNKELFRTPDQNLLEQQVTQLVTPLIALDKNVIETTRTQSEDINKLRRALGMRYESVAEELIRDGAVEVEDIKNTITDETVYDLRRSMTQIDSVVRPTSQYEQKVNAIIKKENLTTQCNQAHLLTETNQREYGKIKLQEIARQRTKKRIVQGLRLARLLRQQIIITQGNAGQIPLMNDDEIVKQAGEYVRKHKNTGLVEKERFQLEDALEQLKTAYVKLPPEGYRIEVQKKLLPNEYAMLKSLIEGKSERDKVYKLAEARLREEITEGISEEQVKTALLQKLIDVALRKYLETVAPEAVDQAILVYGIGDGNTLPNLEAMLQNKDAIIAKATSILKTRIGMNTEGSAALADNIHNRNRSVTVLFRQKRGKHINDDRENETNDSGIDASGLDWNPILEALGMNSAIKKVELHNLQGLNKGIGETVRLALEYCPLYRPGKFIQSSLIENPQGVEDILSSRVKMKWAATQASLQTINNFLKENGRNLEVKITFADWAVLAGTKSGANEEALHQHERVYREQVSRICGQFGIPYSFQSMSNIVAIHLQQLGIEQFVIAEDSMSMQGVSVNPATILRRLGFKENDLPLRTRGQETRVRQVLKDLLSSCEGNLSIARGLVGAYSVALPILMDNCDLHLTMEGSQNLIDLSTLVIAQTNKATISVLVK